MFKGVKRVEAVNNNRVKGVNGVKDVKDETGSFGCGVITAEGDCLDDEMLNFDARVAVNALVGSIRRFNIVTR